LRGPAVTAGPLNGGKTTGDDAITDGGDRNNYSVIVVLVQEEREKPLVVLLQ